jgi:hypothetical protein
MSPAEILYRTRKELRRQIERRTSGNGKPSGRWPDISGKEFTPGPWFMELGEREKVRSHARERLRWNDAQARLFLEHKFSFFSFSERDFGPAIRWNYDYKRNIETPLDYGPSLDYRDEKRCGNIKYAWEHNRHHHLVELAKACYLTGDRRFGNEVLGQVQSWIEQCPYPRGINWSSALENAIRVINWCFALEFLSASGLGILAENEQLVRRWTLSVYQHLRFISRNLSKYSSANNHLIGELSGLFIGSHCFRFAESEQWNALSRRLLEEEALKQNWPDGVNKEQAVSYQAFVFDFLLLASLLGKRSGKEFSPPFRERLERMAEYVSAMMSDSGAMPRIGDDDEGYAVRLDFSKGCNQYRSILATSGALFNRADLAEKGGRDDEKSFWLLGFPGVRAHESASRREPDRTAFEDGGYYVLRSRDSRMIVDCGPLGYLSLAAHGHADALSVLLDYRGKEFLVDPGTYAYHTDREWRDYFRGTSAHNTVRIEGKDQSVIGGSFLWTEKAEARLVSATGAGVCGRHIGYRRLPQAVIHEREITFVEPGNSYSVTDRISTRGEVQVEQFFHLAPDCRCEKDGEGYRIENGGAVIRIVPSPIIAQADALRGSLDPRAGWYSPGFDRKSPATTLRFSARVKSEAAIMTKIILL